MKFDFMLQECNSLSYMAVILGGTNGRLTLHNERSLCSQLSLNERGEAFPLPG